MSEPVLSVRDLVVKARLDNGARTLIDGVSLDLGRGEILGLVGESGSGKSLLCRSLVRLLPSSLLKIDSGSIRLEGRELTEISDAEMLGVRGGEIGMIFQNPTSHLDPVMRIGDQIAEGIRYHQGLKAREVRTAATEILEQVGFPDPKRQYDSYPHEFSGGMRQRAMIGVALSCSPNILIADEPTTALDVTIQAQILRLLIDIRDKRGLSIILITHDLGIVAQTCDRIAVMRSGRLLEQGPKRTILSRPENPYTIDLINSHPSLPDEAATQSEPARPKTSAKPLLEIDDLCVDFRVGGGFYRGSGAKTVSAVSGVSLQVKPGETIGIVGESGSGKSTLARAVLGLTPISSGHVTFDGVDLTQQKSAGLAKLRRETAMVFQDPFNALNPRLTIGQTLAEVLKVHGKVAKADIPARIGELLDLVGLEREFADRKPRSMSGGQCQRAGIARALAVNPKLIIADECVAALDVTIQAQIIDLFRELTRRMNLTLIFIAHDLAIVRDLCERTVVMYRGEIVEEGRSQEIFSRPKHAYTAALIAAIPDIDPDKPLHGERDAAAAGQTQSAKRMR
ncbi:MULTISPECIES: ABC transporter ATP-binding protein [unclassified Rhizobium]|uniref:dipeptide ABC transporter ATP-binding protein n=1 Tax=unclassified Rhizobium TaxID=2613769 RepID=UPI000DDE4D64|nr:MULTISPECIES: ABC transporter ATP-binding protein [unclassified Rhizobium]MBB3289713.1 peptide/nickel transport system ATP-binding protein [Rhizobium sp. BK252]MBB3404656.1 peptide/nickel transport system ATP-binding protein [Rhizobium sp. BK289]MBB3416972.1 peptide/nickel transport system ATP-binding protein [Rhizobium sp. BK284]MBB3484849.1 peptide/nickel transport system ATP-binding protein [Rhizobium sp. BK347]MDK4718220.1 ABC transporter ATP-binding protein [Rhizobium sp. CNPSo 3968]